MSCTCFTRTFWEGLCEWCTAHPQELPPLDYQQYAHKCIVECQAAFDKIVTDAAIELGRQAGIHVSELHAHQNRETFDV